jgi:hypothetical protein
MIDVNLLFNAGTIILCFVILWFAYKFWKDTK